MSGNFSLYCGKRRSDLRARVGYLSVNCATRRNLRSRKKIIQLLPPWRIVPRERPPFHSHTRDLSRGRELSLYISYIPLRRIPPTRSFYIPPRGFFSSATQSSLLFLTEISRVGALCFSPSLFPSFSCFLVRIFHLGRRRVLLISQSHSLQFFTIKVKISSAWWYELTLDIFSILMIQEMSK